MTVHKTRIIDLVRKANREEIIQEDFELAISEQPVKLRLAMPDIFDILTDQTMAYDSALARCISEGMNDYPINEIEWQKEFDNLKNSEAMRIITESWSKIMARYAEVKDKAKNSRPIMNLVSSGSDAILPESTGIPV